jgi:hypothetical protein
LAGTQAEPSSRSSPFTAPPSAVLSVTLLTWPPATLTPISALTGTPVLPLAGVISIASADAVPVLVLSS